MVRSEHLTTEYNGFIKQPREVNTFREDTRAGYLRGGELGDGLGPLRDGVLGELAGEDEADGGLDLPGRDGGLLVVARQLGGLAGELLEDVVDEGVHDGHGLGGDADVGVHLLQHLEDVDLVRLHALLVLLLPLLLAALLGRWWPLLGLGLLPRRGLLGLLRHRLLLRLGGHGCRWLLLLGRGEVWCCLAGEESAARARRIYWRGEAGSDWWRGACHGSVALIDLIRSQPFAAVCDGRVGCTSARIADVVGVQKTDFFF
uniref:Uncharacterized protein n=1 Tax=Aegilops tauschii subsp. strangulata TaxID=200361 RepID=A0A453FUJ9_AEGTS